MNKRDFFSSPTIYIVVFIYLVMTFLTITFGDQVAAYMFAEDHYFENVGAISLFAASVIFFIVFLRSRDKRVSPKVFWLKQLVYLGLAFVFFFGAGEEISWGQRIFNIQTPETLKAVNDQQETNVHNIEFINGHEIPFELLFDLFWFSLTIALPVASQFIKPVKQFFEKFMPIVPIGIGLMYFTNYIFAKLAKIFFVNLYSYPGVPFVQAVQETKESNYELFLVLVAVFVFSEINKSFKASTAK